jgi:hypothetical protein
VPDRKPSWWRPHSRERAEFYGYLTNARACIHDLEPLLASLANRIEAAKPDEPCDVDAELIAIDHLIWRHNDLMESARGVWLSGDLGSEEFRELDLGPTPASLDLPLFTDKQQAEWAKVQCKRIGERLKQRITFLDRVFIAAKILEGAGEAASLLIGGGVLLKAFKEGGKILLVKTIAKTAVAGGISYIAGKAVDAGLQAAGVEEETIQGVKHAAELVTWLLLLRKIHKSLPARPTPETPKSPVSPPASTNSDTPPVPKAIQSQPPRGPGKNPSGAPDVVVDKARTQPYGTPSAQPKRKKTYPPIEGRLDSPRTPQHTFLQRTIAQEMQATGDYTRIATRMKLSKFSGVKIDPDIEPDNMGLHADGRIDIIEVLSPSQTREKLTAKLLHALSQLPPAMRGGIRVVDPKDAFR